MTGQYYRITTQVQHGKPIVYHINGVKLLSSDIESALAAYNRLQNGFQEPKRHSLEWLRLHGNCTLYFNLTGNTQKGFKVTGVRPRLEQLAINII